MKRRGGGLLLVEDSAEELTEILRAMRKNNLNNRITVLQDGQEALDYLFGSENDPPRVIFLDLKMPGVDGWEVLRRIRKNEKTRHIPVVVISSSSSGTDIQRCYDLGANSYIRKDPRANSPGEHVVEAALYWLDMNIPLEPPGYDR